MGRREQVIKELVLNRVAKCGQCGEGYDLSDINVLGYKEDLWFLMLVCGNCHQAVGVAAVVKEQVIRAGDKAHPVERQSRKTQQPPRPAEITGEPINAGDVRAMQQFLADFDGDFRRLFENPSPTADPS